MELKLNFNWKIHENFLNLSVSLLLPQHLFYLYLFIYFKLTSAVYVCPFLNPFTYSLLFIRLICYFLVSTTSLACLSLILTLIIATSTATHIKSLYYHMPLCTCFFSRAFFLSHTQNLKRFSCWLLSKRLFICIIIIVIHVWMRLGNDRVGRR